MSGRDATAGRQCTSSMRPVFQLALEKLETGARYHAVAEEGVALRDIAEVIGRGLKVPVSSYLRTKRLGPFWMARRLRRSRPSGLRARLPKNGWPGITGPVLALIADLEQMRYHETDMADVASAAPSPAAR